jgi:ATP-dependent DNA helicase RecG
MIANFFKEIGWVDELGSGIRKVHQLTTFYTPSESPEFIEEDVFKTIIPLAKTAQKNYPEKLPRKGAKTTQINDQKQPEKTNQKIIAILLKNPSITREKIMFELGGISASGVKYHLSKLKKEGKIIRVGSDRNGYWKVNLQKKQ